MRKPIAEKIPRYTQYCMFILIAYSTNFLKHLALLKLNLKFNNIFSKRVFICIANIATQFYWTNRRLAWTKRYSPNKIAINVIILNERDQFGLIDILNERDQFKNIHHLFKNIVNSSLADVTSNWSSSMVEVKKIFFSLQCFSKLIFLN